METIPSKTILKYEKLDILKEENPFNSFCSGFLISSFSYKKGKIMEDSKQLNSICNHIKCSKLSAMEPEIIYRYPLEDTKKLELNNLNASICFPSGIKVCYNQNEREIPKNFSTKITNQYGERYYMIMFYFYRKLESNIYNKIYSNHPLKNYLKNFGENIYHTRREKEKLEKDLEECQELGYCEYIYIPYCIALISKYPYINQIEKCLFSIYYLLIENNHKFDNDFINQFIIYLIESVPSPLINTCLYFPIPFEKEKILIYSAFAYNQFNNIDYLNLLSHFNIDNIINIFRLILFEQKILFVDNDLRRMSIIIQSFISLIYPLKWVHTNIPIMSEKMIGYLQTFLPFISGISEDLYNKRCIRQIKVADDGIYIIKINEEIIEYSKGIKSECENIINIPKLPFPIFYKIINELSDIKGVIFRLKNDEKEIYKNKINSSVRDTFLESFAIIFYDFYDYLCEIGDDNVIFNSQLMKQNRNKKDTLFYQYLTDTLLFQNFADNFIKKKIYYLDFINGLRIVREKYIAKDDKKGNILWNNITRTFSKNTIENYNDKEKIKTIYEIENKIYENKSNININNLEKITTYINDIDSSKYQEKDEILRYIIPEKFVLNGNELMLIKNENEIMTRSRRSTGEKKDAMRIFRKRKYSGTFSKRKKIDQEEEISENIKDTISSIFKSIDNIKIDDCLTSMYYEYGREILCNILYQPESKNVKKLREDCFYSLKKICINALIALCNIHENYKTIECSIKLTFSAFYFCKESNEDFLLIDEIRKKLGNNYFMWTKDIFWKGWFELENKEINENNFIEFCQKIQWILLDKMLRLQLEKEFIIGFMKRSLKEKMLEIIKKIKEEDKKNEIKEIYENVKKQLTYVITDYKY